MAYFTDIKYQEYQVKNLSLISPALYFLVCRPLSVLLSPHIFSGLCNIGIYDGRLVTRQEESGGNAAVPCGSTFLGVRLVSDLEGC